MPGSSAVAGWSVGMGRTGFVDMLVSSEKLPYQCRSSLVEREGGCRLVYTGALGGLGMKIGWLLLLVAAAHAQTAPVKAKAQNVPEIPYQSVPNFLKMPPNLYLGEGIGV